jgi:ubiquinone/menaquinone biosynthesis C-methylase UbiE
MEGIPGFGASIYSKIVANSPFIKDFYREVVEEICARFPSGRLLDIGTGPGVIPLAIALKSNGLAVDAIDISSAMVEIAGKNAADAGLSERVKFQFGSAEKIPFQDGSFDLVLTTLSFHHWARPYECLKEVHRVLKAGGELWIYEIKWDLTQENRDQVKKKYGRFLAFLVLNFVRAHSSISLGTIKQVQSYKDLGFSEITPEDRGAFVKLRLVT